MVPLPVVGGESRSLSLSSYRAGMRQQSYNTFDDYDRLADAILAD
ncbi:MAG: hypothetical protein WD532_10975 [Acidimicrobiia bacterium]